MTNTIPYIITIIGPESSGKTTLTRKLADHFGAPWVEEYAREYLNGLGRDYTIEDLPRMASGQRASIDLAVSELQASAVSGQGSRDFISELQSVSNELNANQWLWFETKAMAEQRPVLFVDSGLMSIQLWAKLKYGIKINEVEQYMMDDKTSMYILCRPMIEWEPDPLREAPSLLTRAWIYNHYLDTLNKLHR